MTLEDWAAKHNLVIQSHKIFSRYVPYVFDTEAWNLSDYRVTSVAGDTIWFMPRWEADVRNQRMNIRNCFLIATENELLEAIKERKARGDDFGALCLEELLWEQKQDATT